MKHATILKYLETHKLFMGNIHIYIKISSIGEIELFFFFFDKTYFSLKLVKKTYLFINH